MTTQTSPSIYDFSANSIEGQTVPLSTYKDKVLLIVNTASQCGFTPQYQGLQSIYNKYENQGFAVLGFPCNQFNNQEPGCSVDIKEFLLKNNVEWDVYSKIDVNGKCALSKLIFS